MGAILIAESGSTKTTWCLLAEGKKKMISTQGISPWFLDAASLRAVFQKELYPKLKDLHISEVHYYGTGCGAARNKKMIRDELKLHFKKAGVAVEHDLEAAARALCGHEPGIACILGTGSNSCFFTGKKIAKNSPGLGFILGDEGSGTYLGKKVLQYYLYQTFEGELSDKFESAYHLTRSEILDAVYRQPLPNRFIAQFARFLTENRGHFMVENIIEDAFNDFITTHLFKYRQTWTHPVHFTGGVAWAFRDKLSEMCTDFEIGIGRISKDPMAGLAEYHLNR